MVAPVDQKLTTQEAADFLGISRPTMVKLLEQGKLPYERPAGGRHRRVRLQDLLHYQETSRAERRAILDELTHEPSWFQSYRQTRSNATRNPRSIAQPLDTYGESWSSMIRRGRQKPALAAGQLPEFYAHPCDSN